MDRRLIDDEVESMPAIEPQSSMLDESSERLPHSSTDLSAHNQILIEAGTLPVLELVGGGANTDDTANGADPAATSDTTGDVATDRETRPAETQLSPQTLHQFGRIRTFAAGADRAVVRGGWHEAAMRMSAEQRMEEYARLIRLPRNAGTDHQINDLLIAHFDSARTATQRTAALRLLGDQIQAGNNSAIFPRTALTAQNAGMSIIDAQTRLESPRSTPQERQQAIADRRTALSDLVAVARLTDRENRLQASDLIGELRRGPLRLEGEISQAESAVAREPEERAQAARQRTLRVLNATTPAEAEAHAAALDRLGNEEAQREGRTSTRALSSLARTAISLRGIAANLEDPTNVVRGITNLVRLAADNRQAERLLTAIGATPAGEAFIAAIRNGDPQLAAQLLQDRELKTTIATEINKAQQEIAQLSRVNADAISRVLSQPELLQQALQDSTELDQRTRRQAEDAIETFLRRGAPAERLLQRLTASLRPREDGSVQVSDISPVTLERLRTSLEGMPAAARPMVQRLLDAGRLDRQEVQALRQASESDSLTSRTNALRDLNQISAQRLGRFGGGLESATSQLQTINHVQALHEELRNAIATLRSDRALPVEKQSAVNNALQLVERFWADPAQNSLHGRFRNTVPNVSELITTLREGDNQQILRALSELSTRLPDGRDELNEMRSARVVRNITPESSLADLNSAITRLQEEAAADGQDNAPARRWLAWAEATRSVAQFNDATTRGDATAAAQTLTALAQANTSESRSRLALIVHSLSTANPAEQNRLRVQAENTDGRPVYPVRLGTLSADSQTTLRQTGLRELTRISTAAQLDETTATAMAGAYGRAAETDQLEIRRLMSRAVSSESGTARTAAFRGMVEAMRLDGANAVGLVGPLVRASGRSLQEFYTIAGEVSALARQGNPAALTVLATLATGEIDTEREKPSRWAAEELSRIANDRQHALPAAEAILRAHEAASESRSYSATPGNLRTLGRLVATLDSGNADSPSSRVIQNALTILRQEARGFESAPARAEAALEGLLSMPRHLTTADATFITANIERPIVSTLLDRYAGQLPAEVNRSLATDLLHIATSARPVNGGGFVTRDNLLAAVGSLPAVADALTAAEVRRLAQVVGVNRDNVPEALRTALSNEQCAQLRSMTGRIALNVLARSNADDTRRAAGELISSGITPANIGQREGAALVELYRDGRVRNAEVLRSLDRLTRQMGIPAPMESLLGENGIASDRVVDYARRIRERYGNDAATADSVFRTVIQNVQTVDAVPGRDRAVLMGWDRLSRQEKERLGWTEEPSTNELCRMGLAGLNSTQRERIVRLMNEPANANRNLTDVISATEQAQLLQLGRQTWNALSDDTKERIRWANAAHLSPETVIGQMVNGVLAESHNEALLDNRLYNRLSSTIEQSQIQLTRLNNENVTLNERRAEAYRQLVASTLDGPRTSFSGDVVRLLGTSLPGAVNGALVRNNLGGSQRLAFHTDPGLVIDRLIDRARNEGRDSQLVATQERLLNEIRELSTRINRQSTEAANLSLRVDQLLMVRNTASFTFARNERRTAEADIAALDLLNNYGTNLPPHVADRISEHINGTRTEPGALARFRERGQSQWDSLPDYRINSNGTPRINSHEVFEAALGLRPAVVPAPRGDRSDSATTSQNRGLIQMDARIRGQASDLILQNGLRTLDSDPVLAVFQQLSSRIAGPLSELNQLFRAASEGTPYQSLIDAARSKAEMIRTTLNEIPAEAVRELRGRIATMEQAAQQMQRAGADTQNNQAYAQLLRRIETYKQMHDMANSFDDVRFAQRMRDEDGQPMFDHRQRPMFQGTEYNQILRTVEALTEGGIREANFANNIRRDGPIILASVAAMAATAAACATFGIATPVAVVAFGAVAALVAAEGTREVLRSVNANGYSGFGQYGDHGSEIGNWYRLTDQRSLQGNIVGLARVYGNYQAELWTNVAAGMLTAGLAGGGLNNFGRAIAAQFRNAPNPLHLAYSAERAMGARGSAVAQSYFREFVRNSFEHTVQNAAFAAANELGSSAVRDDFLKGPLREGGWAGHQALSFGLSTALAMGQGLLTGARMHQNSSEFRFNLRNGVSETDFVRFMQREGFVVTRSQTHAGQWEAVPVGATAATRPIRLIQERDSVVRQEVRAQLRDAAPAAKTVEQVPAAKTSEQVPRPVEHAPPAKTIDQSPPAKTAEHAPPAKTVDHAPPAKTADHVPAAVPVRQPEQQPEQTPQPQGQARQRRDIGPTFVELAERPADPAQRLVIDHNGTRVELHPTIDRQGYTGVHNGQRFRLALVEDGGKSYLVRTASGASGQGPVQPRDLLARHYENLNNASHLPGVVGEQREALRLACQREYHSTEGTPAQRHARMMRLSNLMDLLSDLQQPRRALDGEQRRLTARVLEGIRTGAYAETQAPPQLDVTGTGNARRVTVGSETYNLELRDGWWYGTHRGAYDSPVKLHVDIANAQDLRHVQSVLIPLIESHPVLQRLVGWWKTMDPNFGAGLRGEGAPPSGRDRAAKASPSIAPTRQIYPLFNALSPKP